MASSPMIRARRMTRSVRGGQEVLNYLQTPEARVLLTQAAERGIPPVTAVSHKLTELLGSDVFESMLMRQFCGLVARAVLEEEGFVLSKPGVRVRNDPVFMSGAVYAKRVGSAPQERDSLLKRILDSLSIQELRWVALYVATQLQNSENDRRRPR
jgi:hypothetical protein